jgi:peptide/nickel transport system substrate-binding protein
MRYRIYHFISVLVLCALIIGCTKPDEQIIRFGLASMPSNIDPRYATDAAATRIGRLLYERLVDFDEQMRPSPDLAHWEKLSDQHYRFHLKKNRHFHNGAALTSSDVKATYEYVLEKKHASPHRGALMMIDEIHTPDPHTIEFVLNRPDPLFPGYLLIGIVPKTLIDAGHRFEREPMGSGPFRFSGWPEEGKLQIQRLSDQQLVEFVHVPNPTVRVLKLMRGEIDLAQNDIPPELVNFLADSQGINVTRRQGSNFAYIGLNTQDPELGQLEIRQALAHAINRDEIIQYVFGNAARPANALLPPTHWAGNDQLQDYEYNPEKARAILSKLGFNADTPLPLTFKTSNDPFRVRLATILQSQLKLVGIDLDIRSYDWGTFYGDIKAGRFQLFSLAWIGIKTPDIYRYVFHSSATPPNGANRGHFSNPEIDTLIEEAERLPDLSAQAIKYKALQALVHQQLPYIPMWYEDHVVLSRSSISGYTLPADGNYDGLLNTRKQP